MSEWAGNYYNQDYLINITMTSLSRIINNIHKYI